MTETTDKPKLGARAPLGLKRTIETGKVKQSFSHGRSNTVVVEVKKRRMLGRPGEAEAPKVEQAPEIVAAPPVAKTPTPEPQRTTPRASDASSRRELQEKLLREAEEARMTSLEEARRREDRKALEATEDEKRRTEENRRAEDEARLQAEENARHAAEEAARAPSK